MAEVGCLKDEIFNNLEVNGSLILSDGNSLGGGSTSTISVVEGSNQIGDFLLTPEMSGSIIKISTVSTGNLILPTPQLGLNYKFVLTEVNNPPSLGNDRIIKATIDGNPNNTESLIFGKLNNNGSMIEMNSRSTITFKSWTGSAGAVSGNFIDIYCISTSTVNNSKTWVFNAVTIITDAIV